MMAALEYSRVHNAVGAAGVQRRALREAVQWAKSRQSLWPCACRDIPWCRTNCSESACASRPVRCWRLKRRWHSMPPPRIANRKGTWLRLVTALAKYLTAEDAIRATRAALELIGSNGYTSDYPIARIYRDAQVLTVWEGPANIQALELLRLLAPKYAGQGSVRAPRSWHHRPSAACHVITAERSCFTAAGRRCRNCICHRRRSQLATICAKAPGAFESQPRIRLHVREPLRRHTANGDDRRLLTATRYYEETRRAEAWRRE